MTPKGWAILVVALELPLKGILDYEAGDDIGDLKTATRSPPGAAHPAYYRNWIHYRLFYIVRFAEKAEIAICFLPYPARNSVPEP